MSQLNASLEVCETDNDLKHVWPALRRVSVSEHELVTYGTPGDKHTGTLRAHVYRDLRRYKRRKHPNNAHSRVGLITGGGTMEHSRMLKLAALALVVLVVTPAPIAANDQPAKATSYGLSVETNVTWGPFEKFLGHSPRVIRSFVKDVIELLKEFKLRQTALLPVAVQLVIVLLRTIGKTLHKEKETGFFVSDLDNVMDEVRHSSPLAEKEVEEAKKEVPDPIKCILGLVTKLLGGAPQPGKDGPHGGSGPNGKGLGEKGPGGDLLGGLPLGKELGGAGGLTKGLGGGLGGAGGLTKGLSGGLGGAGGLTKGLPLPVGGGGLGVESLLGR